MLTKLLWSSVHGVLTYPTVVLSPCCASRSRGLLSFSFFKMYLFTWLPQVLIAARGLFCCGVHAPSLRPVALSCTRACGIFVPRSGVEPTFPCITRWILNHWTTRKVPGLLLNHSKSKLHSDQ